jgi:hypothetical protein
MTAAKGATYQARQLVVYLGHPQSAAVVEVRMSPSGRFVRADGTSDSTRVWIDRVHGLVSGPRVAMEEMAPPDVPLDPSEIQSKYEVEVEAATSALGVQVVPLSLVRRSDGRLVERLWVQPSSGVVYRRELYGTKGAIVGMMTMLEMKWGSSDRAEPYQGMRPTQVKPRDARSAPASLAYGYKLQSASRIEAAGRPATHWLYSDGLHALSVFKLAGELRSPSNYRRVRLGRVPAWAGPGPGTWMWHGGGATWAVVADEPQLDPIELAGPFPKSDRSLWSRLGSWWSGAYHWTRSRIRSE